MLFLTYRGRFDVCTLVLERYTIRTRIRRHLASITFTVLARGSITGIQEQCWSTGSATYISLRERSHEIAPKINKCMVYNTHLFVADTCHMRATAASCVPSFASQNAYCCPSLRQKRTLKEYLLISCGIKSSACK